MQANLIGAFETNRRKAQLYFFDPRCTFDRLDRSSFVAANELDVSVNDHLRSINVPAAKLGRVGTLPFAVFMRREGILPSDIIPIIYVFTENDQLRAAYRLGSVEPF